MVERAVINLINEYVRELLRNNINLSKVILYGSYAKGNQNSESDIDLILVSAP